MTSSRLPPASGGEGEPDPGSGLRQALGARAEGRAARGGWLVGAEPERAGGATRPADETLDALLRGRLRLWQPRRGARVTLDALLLVDFARQACPGGRLGRVLDLGCGGGVIGLALALGDSRAQVVGVDLLAEMCALARRNAAENGVAPRFRAVEGDVARARHLPLEPDSYDLVVSNPPYHPGGEGRAARGPRAIARHEIGASLRDFVLAARRFVKPTGRVAVVFPAERMPDLIATLAEARLPVRALRPVHTVADEPARRVLVLGHRGYRGGTQLLPPLVVHGADRRTYTPEAGRILGDL